MVTVIHHNDPDGFLSAFWVLKCYNTECEFISIDYNYEQFPEVKNKEVFIVDFAPREEDMLSLLASDKKIHWIDHHKTSKNRYGDLTKTIPGYRNYEYAACVLTFLYIHYHLGKVIDGEEGEPENFSGVPYFARLIGDYDAWRYDYKPETLLFYNGIQLEDMSPEEGIWKDLFYEFEEADISEYNSLFQEIIERGQTVLKYREQFGSLYCKNYGSFASLPGVEHKIFAINIARPSSLFFDSAPKADIYAAYVRTDSGWVVSLYSSTIDVAEVAKKFGGGGHKGASGFVSKELLFDFKK